MNFRSLANRAKQIVDLRGGSGALKQDAQGLRDIARGPGTVGHKAKAAAQALHEPGASRTQSPARAEKRSGQPREPMPLNSAPGVEPPASG